MRGGGGRGQQGGPEHPRDWTSDQVLIINIKIKAFFRLNCLAMNTQLAPTAACYRCKCLTPRAREGSVRTKQRKSQAGRLNSSGKPATRQTTYDSTEMSSMASTSNGSFNSIRAEQKYQKKTRAKQQQGCDCGPLLDKIGKTIQRDRSCHWL